MRKRSLFEFCDWLLWTLIGLLPMLYALFTSIYIDNGVIAYRGFQAGLQQFFAEGSYNMTINNNILYGALVKLFSDQLATTGIYLGSTVIFKAIAFFGTMQIVHFVFDVLLIIPRLAMKLCDKFSK